MVYAGTLSERFDAPFVSAVLDHLGSWTLELYGECRYAGRGSGPDGELRRLLNEHYGRVIWHGPVGRERLAQMVKVIIDENVLGVIVARIGDTVIDGTVRRRLAQLKERI